MIFDTIKNVKLYEPISTGIKSALNYLTEHDFTKFEKGRYEIDGDNLFLLVQQYDSILKNEGKWECHKKYIDIQYIVEGVELIGYNNIDNMRFITEYIPEKDIAFLSGHGNYLNVTSGFYCIFFPQDAHQPKIAPENTPGPIKKVVIKIKI